MEFDGQQSDEMVIQVFRKHWSVLGGRLFGPSLLLLGGSYLIFSQTMAPFLLLSVLVILFISAVLVLVVFIKWYFSIYIITNQRLRFVDQKGLFGRATVDLFIKDIYSVSSSVGGIIASMGKFGDLTIEARAGQLFIKRLASVDECYNLLQAGINQTKREA